MKKCYAYQGSKWKIAHDVWDHLGDVHHFTDPFTGSLSILLSRPQTNLPIVVETVGDYDGFVINFWKSIRRDPQAVAYHFQSPVAEVEMQSRHKWLRSQRSIIEKLLEDPNFYDAKLAGWWQWGMDLSTDSSQWCGPQEHFYNTVGWSRTTAPLRRLSEQALVEGYEALAVRLKNVGIAYSGWEHTINYGSRKKRGSQGYFLDPPYGHRCRKGTNYSKDDKEVSQAVGEWAKINGRDPNYRIVLCGYEGEHHMPKDWRKYEWKSDNGKSNREKERVWVSPYCL